MKNVLIIAGILLFISCSNEKKEVLIADISCGQCQFGLTSQDGCDLAVKMNNTAYFVDGFHIDDFGDAHDKETGFCEVIRKAEITGKIEDDRFKATSIKLIDKK